MRRMTLLVVLAVWVAAGSLTMMMLSALFRGARSAQSTGVDATDRAASIDIPDARGPRLGDLQLVVGPPGDLPDVVTLPEQGPGDADHRHHGERSLAPPTTRLPLPG